MTGQPPSVHLLHLTRDYDNWGSRPVSTVASLDTDHPGFDQPVGVDIAPHVNGYQITVRIPPVLPPDSARPYVGQPVVVWLGIVSHRLGEGYPERLIDAMVSSYLDGYVG